MRIYFTGAHASGKSTLANYISKKHNLPKINEVARAVLSEKELNFNTIRSNLDLVDEFQNDVFFRQIEEEKSLKSFVSDRSFDCLAYTAQHSSILNKLINTQELKDYIDSLRKDDVRLFFIRPAKFALSISHDGVRENINWDSMVAIDAMCKFMLEMWNLNYYQIDTENIRERIRLVESVISI